MSICYLLIGVPASGKSTWIKNNIGLFDSIASSDDTIEQVAEEYGFTYNESFSKLIDFATMVLNKDLKVAIQNQHRIAIDRTNVSSKKRKHFIDMFKRAGYKVVAVYFPTPPKEEWERRLSDRSGKTIPQNVLNSMANNLVPPSLEEGFDEIITNPIVKNHLMNLIKNWKIWNKTTGSIPIFIIGDIYNDEHLRYDDGTRISTSPLIETDFANKVVTTKNTTYNLE